jgi:hypothetical protein
MDRDTLITMLDRFAAAETALGQSAIAAQILDHDNQVIRQLVHIWRGRFETNVAVVRAWALSALFVIGVVMPLMSHFYDNAGGREAAIIAILGGVALIIGTVMYQVEGVAVLRFNKRRANLAGQVLARAGRADYAGMLLANLYFVVDEQHQKIVLAVPIADALAQALSQESSIDFESLSNSQRGCTRMFLARPKDQVNRDSLVISLLDGIHQSSAVEFINSIRYVARHGANDRVKAAGRSYAASLQAVIDQQRQSDLLLRAAQSIDEQRSLLRAASLSQSVGPDSLLRVVGQVDGDESPV